LLALLTDIGNTELIDGLTDHQLIITQNPFISALIGIYNGSWVTQILKHIDTHCKHAKPKFTA